MRIITHSCFAIVLFLLNLIWNIECIGRLGSVKFLIEIGVIILHLHFIFGHRYIFKCVFLSSGRR